MTKPLARALALVLAAGLLACQGGAVGVEQRSTGAVSEDHPLAADTFADDESFELYAINASQYGTKYRETMILMQNRKGLRIEYCVDRSALEIWISPQAGESLSYVDQNWSNRDDHTNVFDRILIPTLSLPQLEKVDWDPFHSTVFFENKTLHLAQVYDQPAVLVWFEGAGEVDFKTFGTAVDRSDHAFVMNHADRGRDFQSAAVMSPGPGAFTHQMVLAPERSTHARANLKEGQFLVIASELRTEQIGERAREIAATPLETLLAKSEKKIAADTSTGLFTFRDRPKMQKLLDVSRRVALSMQSFEGFMRSTNQYIYYLLWFRDGGMNTPHLTYSGWAEPVRQHVKMALLNPNVTEEEPAGRFFGMTLSGELSKWEQDGLFYVIWPAFIYWTQTGDDTFVKGEHLQVMKDAMDWLERRGYDEELGLFGRYHYCETPYAQSRGDGFDNATGAPTYPNDSQYEGTTVVKGYDIYMNSLAYASYVMLAAMEEGAAAAEYLRKADGLEAAIRDFFDYEGPRPSFGDVLSADGDLIRTKPYGMDIWDYVWGLSLPPFTPTMPAAYRDAREALYRDMTTTDRGYFLCTYFGLLMSMDTLIHEEDDLIAAMDKLVDYSIAPGKYLPMPYAMPEMFNISEENPFHDVRPLVYSIAPWMSAAANLGLRRLPFGIAARPSNHLAGFEDYVYQGGLFDVTYEGAGEIDTVLLNGAPLEHTLQIPLSLVEEGHNTLDVRLSAGAESRTLWIGSTVELYSVKASDGGAVEYAVQAYGKNVLTFQNLDGIVEVADSAGEPVDVETVVMDDLSYLEFDGRGAHTVTRR